MVVKGSKVVLASGVGCAPAMPLHAGYPGRTRESADRSESTGRKQGRYTHLVMVITAQQFRLCRRTLHHVCF